VTLGTGLPQWLRFILLGHPKVNLIVTSAGQRVLVDSGYCSDASRTARLGSGAYCRLAPVDTITLAAVNTYQPGQQ
jgi:hypothetical protein